MNRQTFFQHLCMYNDIPSAKIWILKDYFLIQPTQEGPNFWGTFSKPSYLNLSEIQNPLQLLTNPNIQLRDLIKRFQTTSPDHSI